VPTIETTRVATPKPVGRVASAPAVPETPPATKSKKKRMLLVLVVLLVAGAGAYFLLAPKKSTAASAPKPGAVVALDATTLNLADGHFLKLKLGLQLIAGKGSALDPSEAADITISEFTNRPMAGLATDAARSAVKAGLLKKLQTAYPGKIMGVYFTQFVMQ